MQCPPFAINLPRQLRNPEPDPLENVPRVLVWPVQIRFIQRGFPGLDIGFGGIDPSCALKNLPKGIQDEVDGDANVCGDEVVGSPRHERIESVEQDDH